MSLLFRTALALMVVTAGAAFAQDHTAHDHAAHDHAAHDQSPATQAASQPATTATSQPASPPTTAPTGSPEAAAVINTTCPVMAGQPINEEVHTTYQGKTVYFCCAGCIQAFNNNPERYLSQLPQFSAATE